MKTHLDRRLRLQAEPEYKTLYPWAIEEVDETDRAVGRHQVPWRWSLYFSATELLLKDELVVNETTEFEGRLPQQESVSRRRTISAKLLPGDSRRDEGDWTHRTSYRMFGTDRVIVDFQLEVLSLDSDDEVERCEAWGSVRYTDESDFLDQTTDDCIIFYVWLKPTEFATYAARIEADTIQQLVLCVGMVSGFYSDWSPAVSTDAIKVLTPDKDQVVEAPAGIKFEPPRLGAVGEMRLYLVSRRTIGAQIALNDDGSVAQSVTSALVAGEGSPEEPRPNKQLRDLARAISVVACLLAVIAVLLLIRG